MSFSTTSSSSSTSNVLATMNPNDKTAVDVPEELRKALLDFSVAFLVDKPKDVVNYAVNYFTSLQVQRMKQRGPLGSVKSEISNYSMLARLLENSVTEHGSIYARSKERRSSVIRSLSESAALPPRTSILREVERTSAEQRLSMHSQLERLSADYRSFSERSSADRRSVERRVSIHPDTEHLSGDRRSDTERLSAERRSGERRVSMHPDIERSSGDHMPNTERLSTERKSVERRVSINPEIQRVSQDYISYAESFSSGRKSGDHRGSTHSDIERPSGYRMSYTEHLSAERRSTELRSLENRVSLIKYTGKSPPANVHYTYEPLPRRKSLFTEAFDTGDIRADEDDPRAQWDQTLVDRRKSFFSESFDPNKSEEDEEFEWRDGNLAKTNEQVQRIKSSLKKVLIFNQLDKQQIRDIVDCMTERRVREGEIVVEQDTIANDFYVVDKGIFKIYKDDIHVHTFHNEGVFGELALISTRLRLATIKASTAGVLWVLNRRKFRHIVESKAYYKRKFYERELRKVYMLQVLPKDKLMTLADSLQERSYRKGDPIFLQGQKPDGMYIVLQGVVQIKAKDVHGIEKNVHKIGESQQYFEELALLKINSKSGETQDVQKKNQNQKFFGELSLLKKQHTERFVSAYAGTHHLKLAFLSLESFERIVGDSVEECYQAISENHPHYSNLLKFYRSLNLGGKLL